MATEALVEGTWALRSVLWSEGKGKLGRVAHPAAQSTTQRQGTEVSQLQWTPRTSWKGSLSAQHLTDRQQEQAQSSADALPSHGNGNSNSTSSRAGGQGPAGGGGWDMGLRQPSAGGSPPMVFVLWLQ